MATTLLTPDTIGIATELLEWAHSYLTGDHPMMRRPVGSQAVCPFVGPSIEHNTFYMSFFPEVAGRDERQIETIALDNVPVFKKLGPFGPGDKNRKALLLVFPNIPESETTVLDIVHEGIKSVFVDQGLMVGQFHKRCKVPSIHNRAFQVSVSPIPLIAMRNMAIHDILFVKNNREWFNAYNLRFGEKFNRPEDIEEFNRHLVEHYFEAKERWL